MTNWAISGDYLESCDCEAICPCRRIGGRAGGRSTYGICLGALSWAIEDGQRGDDRQREAIARILTGKEGGTPHKQFPWAFKESNMLGWRAAPIEIDHAP